MTTHSHAPTLVIIRHAHRNKPLGGEADNGLSSKGKKQAQALLRFYGEMFGKTRPIVYSSPKLRCIETVDPIARKRKTSVEILDSLNEAPTDSLLQNRVRAFETHWLNDPAPLTLACSHGDWIPLFLKKLFGIPIELDKGGWVQIELENGQPQLRWVVQRIEVV